jgi:hypothetical protein
MTQDIEDRYEAFRRSIHKMTHDFIEAELKLGNDYYYQIPKIAIGALLFCAAAFQGAYEAVGVTLVDDELNSILRRLQKESRQKATIFLAEEQNEQKKSDNGS